MSLSVLLTQNSQADPRHEIAVQPVAGPALVQTRVSLADGLESELRAETLAPVSIQSRPLDLRRRLPAGTTRHMELFSNRRAHLVCGPVEPLELDCVVQSNVALYVVAVD